MAYKLLVVDDEKDVVDVVSEKLIRQGYEVVTAYTGTEALDKVRSDNPDIILLDLILPGLNGFEVLREIREKHKDKWRPVIIISSKNELETVMDCYHLEADLYLTKPCSIMDITAAIKKMTDILSLKTQD